MIILRTLLRAEDGSFVPVEEVGVAPPDPRWVEGAIELVVHEKVILDQSLWDYVPEMWAYIARAADECDRTGYGSTYFPDQPVLFELRKADPHRTVVSVSASGLPRRAAAADSYDLFQALYHHGAEFFRRMSELAGISDDAAVERLRRAAAHARQP
jgi:hypothetical protein